MMTSTEIAKLWKQAFGDVAPVGFLCRDELHPRWLRIHSLPDAKRYPDDEAEDRELLHRHNEVATDLLGEGEECILFAAAFDDLPVVQGTTFVDVPELSFDGEGEDASIHIAAARVSWERGRFDSLIRAVADETAGPLLFANFGRRTAYAPYDGGADLFCESPEHVALTKEKWRAWLSPRPDGL